MSEPERNSLLTIYVDADACPVKNEVYRVAERFAVPVILVANKAMRVPEEQWIELVLVDATADAADHWIVERIQPDDVVVTNDILLAERCLRGCQAHPITPTGKLYTLSNIGEALARRELLSRLREWGDSEYGPAPFTRADRSRFLQTLHETMMRVKRERDS